MSEEWAKEGHERELERHHKIVASLSVPLTGVLALGGLNFFLFNEFAKLLENQQAVAAFVGAILIVISFLPLAASVICLMAAHAGQNYSYLNPVKDYKDHEKALIEYYRAQNWENPELRAEQEVNDIHSQHLYNSERDNFYANNRKSAWRHWAHVSLFSAVIVTLIAFTFWFVPELTILGNVEWDSSKGGGS